LLPVLREMIAARGPLSFPEFMEMVLYHPQWGYYADPERKIGRHGDFFTSVSVGPVFSIIVARWVLARWQALDRPDAWRLAEPGAHDGTLLRELVAELRRLDPAATAGLTLTVPEPLAARRPLLEQALAGLPVAAVEVFDPATAAPPPALPGILLANEVLDALPCHLVEFDGSAWVELMVGGNENQGLEFQPGPLSEKWLTAATDRLGVQYPPGYRTEFRDYRDFLQPLRDLLLRGSMLFIDYGFARPEFYHPDRRRGTLRTFSKHCAGDDPLESPGRQDLTAHVDFTAVSEAAGKLGMEPAAFQPQERFLTDSGRDWIESLSDLTTEKRAPLVRQFQTLTHPAQLGARFHALELAWWCPVDAEQARMARERLAMR
jgi:SAM-dependent MidA family methyltransferase